MLFRNRGQNIPVVAQTLFGRPVGYLLALNFKKAGVLAYDSSPLSSVAAGLAAEPQWLVLRIILS
jgi:hypothetical protein